MAGFVEGPESGTLIGDGALWRIEEEALVGPDDARLARMPGHVAYWFAWAGYLGDRAEFYQGPVSSGG